MGRILRDIDLGSRDTVAIARSLLGCKLVVQVGDAVRSLAITEVEAYNGPEDRACHASRGRTARTSVLFGPPGHWYVYLCYGIHEMLNLVTGPEGYPAAVLIRGLDGLVGPGRVTKGLGIDRRFNAQPALPATGLWIERGARAPEDSAILATPRIGVDYAGVEWAAKPWRFVLQPPAPDPARKSRRPARG